jgi:hypothetical protein
LPYPHASRSNVRRGVACLTLIRFGRDASCLVRAEQAPPLQSVRGCAPFVVLHCPVGLFTGTSVERPQGVVAVCPLLYCRMYQVPFEGRKMAISVFSSPS